MRYKNKISRLCRSSVVTADDLRYSTNHFDLKGLQAQALRTSATPHQDVNSRADGEISVGPQLVGNIRAKVSPTNDVPSFLSCHCL